MRAYFAAFMIALLACIAVGPVYAAQEPGYFTQMGRTFSRGFKNTVSFPWEIPSTIAKYDGKSDGNPRAFRDMAGFVDGTFRAVTRLGCGVWDMAFSVVPGQQEGLTLDPEAFF